MLSVLSDPKWNGLIQCTFNALVMPSFLVTCGIYELKLVANTTCGGKNIGRITLLLSSYLSSLFSAGHFKEVEL